jgi:hypothetical protein
MLSFAQNLDTPTAEVFGGYSWYRAGGKVNSVAVPDFSKGWAGQYTHNLNQWAGLTVDVSGHYNGVAHAQGLAGGPQFKLRRGPFVPFGEVLLGFQNFAPKNLASQNARTFMVGGGLDIRITPRLSIRPLQVDFVNSYYSPATESNSFNGARVQGGVVFNFGQPSWEREVSADCSATPSMVSEGTPVKIEVAAKGFVPGRTLRYAYSTSGGVLDSHDATAFVDTTNLDSGRYTVNVLVEDNGRGIRHQQATTCRAVFGIYPKQPPAASMSADPASLKQGESSTITVHGSSAENRPLSYSCAASGGRLSGAGPEYTLQTAGSGAGTVTVKCTVGDDRGRTATTAISVEVHAPAKVEAAPVVVAEAPPMTAPRAVAASPPQPAKFGTIEFKHDVKRPTRVDNEAKGELDRYADALAAWPDAKGVLVGNAARDEAVKHRRMHPRLFRGFAARRAVNTKGYLSKEKGLDPARLQALVRRGDEQTTELWIVPAGATFNVMGTRVVDETRVKARPRLAPTANKKHRAKKTHRKKTHGKLPKSH